jgi:hypothetical protein
MQEFASLKPQLSISPQQPPQNEFTLKSSQKGASVNQKHPPTWWSPVVHFGVHIVVGFLIFVLISLPAFGLGLLVQYLAIHGTAPYVIQVLTLLEYAIVTIDAMAFLAYLVITGIHAVREMTE